MYKHLLVPTDGTVLATETIGQALEFARALGARVTFFYAKPDYSASLLSDAEVVRNVSPEHFEYSYEGRPREFLSKAEVAAEEAGVSCTSVSKVSDTPYRAIIEAAEENGCDLIYMASHGRGSTLGMMIGSQTLKVLVHSHIPVLVSTSHEPAASNRAIAIIHDEHRSLGAVLHALTAVSGEASHSGVRPNMELLRSILHYIRVFPVALHHPKEDAYLFDKLRKRTHEVDATIDELERQHVEDEKKVGELQAMLEQVETGAAGGLEAFHDAAESYSRFVWGHLGMEENVIIPAARRHLTAEDWEDIRMAFSTNNDPRFGGGVDADLRKLYSRIVNLIKPMTGKASDAPKGNVTA